MDTVKVSVVVPVYNKAPYLAEAFASIFAQTYTDFEVIAVDDRSTDQSLSILRSFTDPRLRIIVLERNLGPAGAMQRAMDAARGEYIARMDADDLMHPQRLELQVAFMDAHPSIGASGGELILFGSDTNRWTFPLKDEDCKAQLLFGVPIAQPASILRTAVLRKHHIRYRDEWPRVGEDWLFFASIAPHTRFGNLAQALVSYRRGEQNISHGRDKIMDHRVILEHLFKLYGIPATNTDIDTHLMALTYFVHSPNIADIKRLRKWLNRLIEMNRDKKLFPQDAVIRRTEKSWDKIFYYLPAYGLTPSLAHIWLSGRGPWSRLLYLAKVLARKRMKLS